MRRTNPLPRKIRADLKRVERLLEQVSSEARGELGDAALATIKAGGKRLRPALVLLCAALGEYDVPRAVRAAAAVELIHTASLVHDDVLDSAPLRRGHPTVHTRWNRRTAFAVGDYMFSRAFELVAGLGESAALKAMAGTARDLTVGELQQRSCASRKDFDEQAYLARIRNKTASLFATSCFLGAQVGKLGERLSKQVASYGSNLGMAFQVYDDVLDIVTPTEDLGKETGTDLKDGTITLPVIYALRQAGGSAWVTEAVGSDEGVARALRIINETDALALAKDKAKAFVGTAMEAIKSLDPGPVAKALRSIGEFVVERYH